MHFIFRDAVSLSLVNCCTSVFAGMVVFSVLGHMSDRTNTPIEDVVTSGKWIHVFVKSLSSFETLLTCWKLKTVASIMSGYNQGMRYFFDRTNYFHVVNFAFFLKISLLFNVFLYVCKQTFRKLYGYITREFWELRMQNFQG